MRKIVEFYVAKEKELLSDLVVLKADIERIEDEEEAHYSGANGGGMQSADSDEEREDYDEEEEEEGDEDDIERKAAHRSARGAIESALSNPAKYGEAARAERKVRNSSSFRQQRRRRASSDVSALSGSALLHESDEDRQLVQAPSRSIPASPLKTRRTSSMNAGGASNRPQSRMMRASRTGLTSRYEDDDLDGAGGIWGSNSDWAIDMKIMYKRRVTAVFTASQIFLSSNLLDRTMH